MTSKRLCSKIVCGLFAAMAVASIGVMGAGATAVDYPYSFSFNQYQSEQYTRTLTKDNNTDLYFWVNKTSGGAVLARAYGSNHSRSQTDNEPNGRVDCSRGNFYTMRLNAPTYMRNWVHENGYTYASIKGTPTTSTNAGVEGVWSADSVR